MEGLYSLNSVLILVNLCKNEEWKTRNARKINNQEELLVEGFKEYAA